MNLPDAVFWSCFAFGLLSVFWELYLSWRQYTKRRNTPELPDDFREIVDEDVYKKARLYNLDRARFDIVMSIWQASENSIILLFNLIVIFWDISGHIATSWGYNGEIIQSLVFVSLASIIDHVINLPWKMYSTLVIEEKHGFNKQTLGFFLKDQFKKMILMLVISLPVVTAMIWIIRVGGDYFFLFVWAFLLILTFFLMTVYPEFIAPLFDKYTPLKDGELKSKIEALASRVEFPLKKLYVVEGSKRSAHSNAYMYGFWKNKRIVLYDTLIANYNADDDKQVQNTTEPPGHVTNVGKGKEVKSDDFLTGDWEKSEIGEAENTTKRSEPPAKGEVVETKNEEASIDAPASESKPNPSAKKDLGMSDDEVVAVLGHELGHWKMNHTLYNIIVAELNMFLCLMIFSFLYKCPVLYEAFGFTKSQPILIGLMIIFVFVFAPYNEIVNFLMICWSRRCEFSADNFSAQLGLAPQLRSSLIKMTKDNLVNPVNDELYSKWHHSHPPTSERVENLKKFQ